jgi:hypothetical protein
MTCQFERQVHGIEFAWTRRRPVSVSQHLEMVTAEQTYIVLNVRLRGDGDTRSECDAGIRSRRSCDFHT